MSYSNVKMLLALTAGTFCFALSAVGAGGGGSEDIHMGNHSLEDADSESEDGDKERVPSGVGSSTQTATSVASSAFHDSSGKHPPELQDAAGGHVFVTAVRFHARNHRDCMHKLLHDLPRAGGDVVELIADNQENAIRILCRRYFPDVGPIDGDLLGGCQIPSGCEEQTGGKSSCQALAKAMAHVTETQCQNECRKMGKPVQMCHWNAYLLPGRPPRNWGRGQCNVHIRESYDVGSVANHNDVDKEKCESLCASARANGKNVERCQWLSPADLEQQAQEPPRPLQPAEALKKSDPDKEQDGEE